MLNDQKIDFLTALALFAMRLRGDVEENLREMMRHGLFVIGATENLPEELVNEFVGGFCVHLVLEQEAADVE